MTTPTTTDPVAALKDVHRAIWASGDYPAVAAHIADGPPAHAIAAAGVARGDRVLDVATGDGNAALAAARAGARVTGQDLTPELVDAARVRARAEGLDVTWDVGDAEALPYADGAFDRVLSVFGIQFAPRHQVAADELVRVCRPGGTIALVNWTPDGLIGQVLKTIGSHLPAPPAFASPPPRWGDEEHVRGLFSEHDCVVAFARFTNPFRFPSADAFLSFLETRYGPVLTARGKLEAAGTWSACRAEVRAVLEAADAADGDAYEGRSEYVVVAVRKDG